MLPIRQCKLTHRLSDWLIENRTIFNLQRSESVCERDCACLRERRKTVRSFFSPSQPREVYQYHRTTDKLLHTNKSHTSVLFHSRWTSTSSSSPHRRAHTHQTQREEKLSGYLVMRWMSRSLQQSTTLSKAAISLLPETSTPLSARKRSIQPDPPSVRIALSVRFDLKRTQNNNRCSRLRNNQEYFP